MGSSEIITEERNGKESPSIDGETTDSLQPPPSIDDKALTRKIDKKVIPILFMTYFVAFLDRVSIGNALTMGLPKDLHLTGNQVNTVLTVFFVPYVLLEIPSNWLVIKRASPHNWLSLCICAFGVCMLCQGFTHGFGGMVAARFFLGVCESGVFPGCFYLLSFWYSREEAQKRFTVFWCSVPAASAVGGLLATAIANMDGIRGLANWRWVFILEGILTVLVGFAAWFFIADFPEDAKWLTEDERAWLATKTGRDGAPTPPVTPRDLVTFFSDPKNVLGGIMYFSVVVPIYSFSFFGPTIIQTLGYSVVETQLHAVPPVAAAIVLAIIFAVASDYTRVRSVFVFASLVIILVGGCVLISVHDNFHVQYFALHFVAMGAFAGGPIIVCWFVLNLRGHTERSIGAAYQIGFGNIGGIIATYAYLATDAPEYKKGYSAMIAVVCAGFLAVGTYLGIIVYRNKKNKVLTADGKVFHYHL